MDGWSFLRPRLASGGAAFAPAFGAAARAPVLVTSEGGAARRRADRAGVVCTDPILSPKAGGASRPTLRVAPESRCSLRNWRVNVSMRSDRLCGGESARMVVGWAAGRCWKACGTRGAGASMTFASLDSRRKASSWPCRAAAAAAAVQGWDMLRRDDVEVLISDRRCGTRSSPRTDIGEKAGEKAGDAVDRRPGVRRAVDMGACVAGVAVSSELAEPALSLRSRPRAGVVGGACSALLSGGESLSGGGGTWGMSLSVT